MADREEEMRWILSRGLVPSLV
uniref:Uncharacterized protein n=1 Tax=Arundo donax TaxID=35708 RepID=A0A0A9EE09_ARUDO